jgi:predicted CXXCH cytochrome family protein
MNNGCRAGAGALTVLVLVGAGFRPSGPRVRAEELGGTCALAGADRARTPAASCMACHDGSAAQGISFQMRSATGAVVLDHPVDVDYASAALRDRRLVSPAMLPRELVLVGGRVACTTCHDGASRERAHTVRVRADLCTSCHRM